jgi:UPF0755 protein
MLKKKISIAVGLLFLLVGFTGYNYYQKIFGKSVVKDTVLLVFSGDSLMDIHDKISKISKDIDGFLWVAEKKGFTKPKSGRYVLNENMSNNDLVNLLRSGNQTPIKLSFNNQDTLEKLAGRVAQQLETDSISLLNAFKDSLFLSKNNLTKKSVLQIFVPNSYQFYWNTSPKKFRDKIFKEYKRFWNPSRRRKAAKLNLSVAEVITLASIVQKETSKEIERPIVAGLYLNRLKKDWPLQADPTIIYCIKENKGQNYKVKRVLNTDLEINSPYNTYKNKGLPPTLIGMPDISSIDGVLNAQKHNYFYMCVNVEKLGYHSFTRSLSQHNKNASKYHKWLDKQRIRK